MKLEKLARIGDILSIEYAELLVTSSHKLLNLIGNDVENYLSI